MNNGRIQVHMLQNSHEMPDESRKVRRMQVDIQSPGNIEVEWT